MSHHTLSNGRCRTKFNSIILRGVPLAKFWMILFLASVSFGTDVLSIGIRTSFRYEDLKHQCTLPPVAVNFILAAEVQDGQITKMELRKTQMKGYSKVLELSPEEISQIQMQKADSHLWLKNWQVSGRVLEMLFYGGTDQGLDTCYPPESLTSIEPSSFTFTFPSEQTEKLYSDSNEAHFEGTTKSGNAYRIDLLLVQDRI